MYRIVQEISLARKIVVYWGDSGGAEWKKLVRVLKTNKAFADTVPVKLQKQIEGKFTDGHKLQTLLESHQDALCQNPRDKIYGFVGLATDCIEGFPMDYQKSLFEVWKDTMMFKNQVPDNDVMRFGKLVQKLLGGVGIATAEEVTEDINRRVPKLFKDPSDSANNELDLVIPGRLIGRIVYIGPTYDEIISDLKKTARWRASIDRYMRESQRASTREESDYFLETLEEVNDKDLEIVAAYEYVYLTFYESKISRPRLSYK